MTTSDSASARRTNTQATLSTEEQLLRDVEQYLRSNDIEHVTRVLTYANELDQRQRAAPDTAGTGRKEQARHWDVEYGVAVAETLADAIHIDAISLAAVLLYQAVESGLATLDNVRARLGAAFGDEVAQTIQNIARFDMLQRPATAARRSAQGAEGEEPSRDRRRSRERARQQGAETVRRMVVAMSEDPRVAVFKIADQLRLMRAVHVAAEYWREHAPVADAASPDGVSDGSVRSTEQAPRWNADECRFLAEETREIYAPLAGRLGMGRVEGELDDLAFAVLEPDDFHWLSDAVAEYTQVRGGYIERVCEVLQTELRAIGLEAEVSGRAKHLYSIFKKVQRTGSRDLSELYDILAFRIIVETVEQCYLALGHVHALWRPKDGRIKDFIANPKPNGYQSLHTTVFCLDNRLAEIQIRTREMHQVAEYGVAMHWYYKDIGDQASGQSRPLQSWVQQVSEWQNELRGGEPGSGAQGSPPDTRGDQIFVFTPAGDVKELPAGATPLDFAYRIHTDVGNHVAGVRVQSADATGRLVKKLVPLDYELKNGDVVEIIKRKDAHPTRDWLHVAQTKTAKDRIRKYLEAHERDIDMQIGRERLDRELKLLGVRRGFEELSEDDLKWLVEALEQRDTESLLAALGGEKLRTSVLTARLRERFKPAPPVEPEQTEIVPPPAAPARDTQVGANVAGVTGILTQLANCCDPLPGDEVVGFISRGRGVMIHRADCPTLAHLLAKQPERRVAVELPKATGGEHTFRAPIIIEALDRTGLLADVTGVITGMKINMLKVATVTKPAQHKATITATLEIQRPEQLNAVIAELKQVRSVVSVERKRVAQERGRR
ncbi:MAG TPA: TGS domain-containing protein [Ktedonobacterales bacterium]|nr:TGS domain-containing protein [Ktedonobacterales bacterium]